MNARDRVLRTHLPGTPHPNDKVIRNRALYLTYEGHLPKDIYRKWFTEVVMPSYCRGGAIKTLEIAHETPDLIHGCNHTHVVIHTTKQIRSENICILDWMHTPKTSRRQREDLTQAHIMVLRSKEEIGAAMCTLGDEDLEYSSYNDLYAEYEYVFSIRTEKIIDGSYEARCLSLDPRYKRQHLLRWQRDIVTIIDRNSSSEPRVEDINVLWTHPRCGVSTLLRALKHKEPERFLILSGIPSMRQVQGLRSIPQDEWNRDTLIVEAGGIPDTRDLDGITTKIIYTSDELGCHNLWIMTNIIPLLDGVSKERWKFYKVRADWRAGEVENLIDGTLELASGARRELLASRNTAKS